MAVPGPWEEEGVMEAEGHPEMDATAREGERERERVQGVPDCQGLAVPVSNEGATGSAPFTQL